MAHHDFIIEAYNRDFNEYFAALKPDIGILPAKRAARTSILMDRLEKLMKADNRDLAHVQTMMKHHQYALTMHAIHCKG